MSRTLTSANAGSTIVDKLKIYEGGTGATDAAGAAAALNAISLSEVGVPGGIAVLDSTGKIPASSIPSSGISTVNVVGPNEVPVGDSKDFTITNYDVFTNYDVQAVRGAVYRIGKTIIYTAPAVIGDGSGGFTINGRLVNVTVEPIRPSQPVLTVRDVPGSNPDIPALSLESSDFTMNVTSVNTHLNTDWQIATDIGFTNIVAQSLADASNKQTWNSGDLLATTTYYARVRYRDNQNLESKWSDVVSVTTKSVYKLDVEQALLTATVKKPSVYFGQSVALSSDGSRAVVGAYYDYNAQAVRTGAVYVFKRTGSTWTQEAKLEPTPTSATATFGQQVAISDDGNRVFVGSPLDSGTTSFTGAVYVFRRDNTSWVQETRVSDPNPTFTAGAGGSVDSLFGQKLKVDSTGTRMIIGSYANDSTGTNNGRVHIYVRSGTTWTQETAFGPNGDIQNTGYENIFGVEVAISGDGTRVAVSTGAQPGGNTDKRIAIYRRSGSTWTFEQYVTFPNHNGWLTCALDFTGTRIAIGYVNETINFNTDGAVYIWSRTGTTWTQEAKLSQTATTSSTRFGSDLAFNKDGSSIVILRSNDNNAAWGSAMYNYTRVGTTWTFNKKFYSSTTPGTCSSIGISDDGSTAIMGYSNVAVNSVSGIGAAAVFVS